jgi:opacity protein-like surface antigen
MGKTRSIVIGIALALSQAATGHAADLDYAAPLPEPCVGCSGPWYLKGFIGMATPDVGDIFAEEYQFNDFTVYHKDMKSTPLFGVGFGYDTGHYFRFDITGEYRGKGLFIAQDSYPGGSGFTGGANEWTADIESWVGLFNTYIDIGTWHCVTPYVGGGVGFASISVLGLKDVNVPQNGVAFAKDNTETNFAWAVYGGLSYDVNQSVTIDLSYRYLDIGDASSGIRTNYLGTATATGLQIEDITSQDVMLGVRWKLGSQQAPMPVAFK